MLRCLTSSKPIGRQLQGMSLYPPLFCSLICDRRILQISNHQDVVQINLPRGGILNISVADPDDFNDTKGYITSNKHNMFVVSSITAVTTYFSNGSNGMREICVKPFFHSWPRFTAVLGHVFGTKVIHFRSWENGIVFGTGMFDSCGPRLFPDRWDKTHAPIAGAVLPKSEESSHPTCFF